MAAGGIRLGEVKPRERDGARTASRFEYQCERTARAALDLLDDAARHVCVYCDWHDDFVVERGDPPTRYIFHQVKGRSSSKGPWTFSEFFGVAKKRAKKPSKTAARVSADAVVLKMLLHHVNFPGSCDGLVFVTNSGISSELSDFLSEVAGSSDIAGLGAEARIAFDHVAKAYLAADPSLGDSPDRIFSWIRTVSVLTDQGKLDDTNAALLEIADIVERFSEIELVQRESKQIAREIVGRVRTKVVYSSTSVPASDDQLRRDKGILVGDLLAVLSLSLAGYDALRRGDSPNSVKTLSRLQRFCRQHNLEHVVTEVCAFRADWCIWRTTERHFMNSSDYVLLFQKARDALAAGYDLPRLTTEARSIASQFTSHVSEPLRGEHVLGLMFSLAAGVDPSSGTT